MFVAGSASAQRGVVSSVTGTPVDRGPRVIFRVTGVNPCGAVNIDYGDQQVITHPISRLPMSIEHVYERSGAYNVRARGMGNCEGEAVAVVRVVVPADTRPQPGPGQSQMRFAGMDRNGDGVIARSEWRGNEQAFLVHDWNRDGVLSGAEVQPGARRPQGDPQDDYPIGQDNTLTQRFRDLDRNRDGRISRTEWLDDVEAFRRADTDRNNLLTLDEFGNADFDDARMRFEMLDVNRNGRVERSEWRSSADAFTWLDRNRDGVLSRVEVVGAEEADAFDAFTSLDVNRDRRISIDEWTWSRRSFDQRDINGDGLLTRAELGNVPGGAGAGTGGGTVGGAVTTTVVVQSTERWTDTAVSVRAGDLIRFTATGTIQMSEPSDIADPRGSRTGRLAKEAPLPREPAGALIGRVGESEPFLIGALTTAIRMPQSGRLYLSVNDDYLGDNSGQFRVTIATVR
jgi:Ca2+-binding EF-hand superfamily protein